MKIIRGRQKKAQKVVIYGPEGIGKSTLASQFPEPVFIDTEGSTARMDVARFEAPSSWNMLLQYIRYVRDERPCKTLVIDTADWAEQMCIRDFCAQKQISGIEDIGYGKGYVYVAEEFGRMLNLLDEVLAVGIHVVITAHAQMRKFEQPDEMGAYDRWELKLSKKAAPMLKEWADMVLFCNYKTYVINVDGQGAQKGKNKAQGGKRVIYTAHHSCWDAKNREGLPDEMEMSFASLASVIVGSDDPNPPATFPAEAEMKSEKNKQPEPEKVHMPAKTPIAPVSQAVEQSKPSVTHGTVPVSPATSNLPEAMPSPSEARQEPTGTPSAPPGIPKALADLMQAAGYKEPDVQMAVVSRGYYPPGMPIADYDPAFVQGVLIGAWDQVAAMIREIKMQKGEFVDAIPDELPFN
ncbi:MAG: AAA family ATPase [Lachnospiraceae bacterium]|nr:AAA family ATPase [Lachnospiraceae bacterium]